MEVCCRMNSCIPLKTSVRDNFNIYRSDLVTAMWSPYLSRDYLLNRRSKQSALDLGAWACSCSFSSRDSGQLPPAVVTITSRSYTGNRHSLTRDQRILFPELRSDNEQPWLGKVYTKMWRLPKQTFGWIEPGNSAQTNVSQPEPPNLRGHEPANHLINQCEVARSSTTSFPQAFRSFLRGQSSLH